MGDREGTRLSFAGRKVVVTGGAGFIGSHLARALVQAGARVTIVDNFTTGRMTNLADLAEETEIVRGSTLETHRLARAMRGADAVFHLSAVLGVKRTWEEPVRVIHENLLGTENVLRAASDAGAGVVVLASSSEVYGDGEPPYAETRTPAAPRTGYAAAKLAEEKMAEAFTVETGLRTVCLRYFNVYGPRQASSAYGFVTAIFCERAQAGLPPVVFGDGRQTRDFTFVDDAVAATLLAAEVDGPHEVLNVGTGRETSILDLARAVLVAARRHDLAPVHAPRRADEVARRLCDPSKAGARLGFLPKVSLEEGLRRTLAGPRETPPLAST